MKILVILKSFRISFPNSLKLCGQVLIMVALSMQLYVLTLGSEVRTHIASHEANVAYHQTFIDLAIKADSKNILLNMAAENNRKKLKRQNEKFQRKAKKRSAYIKSQGKYAFWAAISFLIGTVLFAIGEYENYRREYMNKQS